MSARVYLTRIVMFVVLTGCSFNQMVFKDWLFFPPCTFAIDELGGNYCHFTHEYLMASVTDFSGTDLKVSYYSNGEVVREEWFEVNKWYRVGDFEFYVHYNDPLAHLMWPTEVQHKFFTEFRYKGSRPEQVTPLYADIVNMPEVLAVPVYCSQYDDNLNDIYCRMWLGEQEGKFSEFDGVDFLLDVSHNQNPVYQGTIRVNQWFESGHVRFYIHYNDAAARAFWGNSEMFHLLFVEVVASGK